jgi:hypothetical protein
MRQKVKTEPRAEDIPALKRQVWRQFWAVIVIEIVVNLSMLVVILVSPGRFDRQTLSVYQCLICSIALVPTFILGVSIARKSQRISEFQKAIGRKYNPRIDGIPNDN